MLSAGLSASGPRTRPSVSSVARAAAAGSTAAILASVRARGAVATPGAGSTAMTGAQFEFEYWLVLGLIRPVAFSNPATERMSPDGGDHRGSGRLKRSQGCRGGRL
jgi:hypothetical protein